MLVIGVLKLLATWLPFTCALNRVALTGTSITLPCDVNSLTQEYNWIHNNHLIDSRFRLPNGQFFNDGTISRENLRIKISNGWLSLSHVDLSDHGSWVCIRKDRSLRIEVEHFLHVLPSNNLSLGLDEVEHGFLDCSSSNALPNDTLKIVKSPFANGTLPTMELTSWSKTVQWSSNKITTRFQLPQMSDWYADHFFVCIQEREVNRRLQTVASTFTTFSEVISKTENEGKSQTSMMENEIQAQSKMPNASQVKRAYVFAHYEHQDWIHGQNQSITCKAILGNPKAELAAVLSKDPLMVDVLQTLTLSTLTEIPQLGIGSAQFEYSSSYRDEGYFVACVGIQRRNNEVTHEAIDSIRILDVKFPPEIVSGFTSQVIYPQGLTVTIKGNPLPTLKDVHLIPCGNPDCERLELPQTELINIGKHSLDIKISFNHKVYKQLEALTLLVENEFGSVNQTIRLTQDPSGSGVLGGIISVVVLLSILLMLAFVLRALVDRDQEEKKAKKMEPFQGLLVKNGGFPEVSNSDVIQMASEKD
ncbi:uncharacterized protein LOC131887421 isoform X2 [Tigriopus californicus]|uniref:uncharacterized protein LOC131887421 isoform X2 n=1 Tax=Tigriopus californicus TaxID=6832 RepID=UPI0027DA7EA5|nr:uncharacterized protein LOC131887421 isoform X2 [Tigriopus californicus]